MAQSSSLSAEMETLSHVLRLVEAFRAFDSDNDGAITAAELGGIMGSLGYNPSDQEIRTMMQQGDKNRDGLLSTEEFLDLNTKDLELGDLANSLKSAFESLDFEGDEYVTGEELFDVMGNLGVNGLGLDECQAIIASMDGDGDGAISFEDFKLIDKEFEILLYFIFFSGAIQLTSIAQAVATPVTPSLSLICNTSIARHHHFNSISFPISTPPKFGGLSIKCARVGGVEIPNAKRVQYSLQYIHGIGRTRALQILNDLKMENKITKDLSEEELSALRDEVSKYMIEGDLRRFNALNIRRLKEIQCYRGVRHIQGLPCRGQRTKNNCRTLKGKKVAIAGKKKAPR